MKRYKEIMNTLESAVFIMIVLFAVWIALHR